MGREVCWDKVATAGTRQGYLEEYGEMLCPSVDVVRIDGDDDDDDDVVTSLRGVMSPPLCHAFHEAFFPRVSYFENSRCVRASNYCVMAVSLPDDWYGAFNCNCHLLLLGYCIVCEFLTLLRFSDIESNFGPKASGNADILTFLLPIVKQLKRRKRAIFE